MTVIETPEPRTDPTLDLAERQLAMLGELAEMAMTAARAFTASAVASAKAAEAILDDEYFMPEVGRANACGARDAAESLQKVTRAVRLTLMLEMKVAEIVRDVRAGVVTHIGGIANSKEAGETPADQGALQVRQSLSRPLSREPAGSCSSDRESNRTSRDRDAEHLIDIERPDILPRAPFRETVEHICGDLGAEVDWTTWSLSPPKPGGETLRSPPSAGDAALKPPARSPPVPARPPG